MSNTLPEIEPTEKLERNANRVILLVLISTILAGIFSTVTYLLVGGDAIAFILTWFVAVVIGIALWLTRRGKGVFGIRLVLGIIWLAILTSPLREAGNGLALGFFSILFTVALAPQTMRPSEALQTIGAGLVLGISTILLDWYWPVERPTTTGTTLTIVYTFGAGLILLNGFFLFRQIQEYSLRAKLTVAFLLVAILAVVSVSVVNNLVNRAELTQQVGTNLETLANTVSTQIGNQLIGQIEILQLAATQFEGVAKSANERYKFAGTPDEIESQLLVLDNEWRNAKGTDQIILDVVNSNVASELRGVREAIPSHVEIFLTDKFGANIAATNRTSDYYQADEAWWQTAYNGGEGGLYISSPVFDESSQTFRIDFAVPVFAGAEFVGVLRSTYDASALTNSLRGVETSGRGHTGHADLRVADDLLLAADQTDLQVIDLATQTQLDAIAENSGAIFLEGEQVLASQVPLVPNSIGDPKSQVIANLGWSLIVHQDETDAFAPLETTTRTTVLSSLALLLVTAVLAVYVSNQLSQPILNLTNVAEQVRAGNFDIQAEATTQDEIGVLAATFNGMTSQIRTLVGTLEQRVAERTRALATSTEVSRRLSTILNQDELVREVVQQVQKAFDYYHVHIYLWDDKRENLVMAGGTGEAGRIMLASGHSIPAERGLVGRAAETGTIVLIPDVSQTIGWLPNPLLPDTKAEIAIPIILGEEVLGVLDVQHYLVSGLDQNDADLLQSIATQVAIALQNARAYATAQGEASREVRRSEIVQKIQATTTIEEALKVAVRELGRAVGVPKAAIRLHTNKTPNGQ